jgi:hypothetical protein
MICEPLPVSHLARLNHVPLRPWLTYPPIALADEHRLLEVAGTEAIVGRVPSHEIFRHVQGAFAELLEEGEEPTGAPRFGASSRGRSVGRTP